MKNMNLFINGLSPSIQTIVARYHEIQPRRSLKYNALVQFARHEKEAFCAQVRSIRDLPTQNTGNQTSNTGVNLSHDSTSYSYYQEEGANGLGED